MLRNYFKIAFRNIRKHKLYALINIFGLTVGITCCIIIYLFISNELSFDKFQADADTIYRVDELSYTKAQSQIEPTPFFDTKLPEGINKSIYLPLPLGPTLKDQIPEITNFTRFAQSGALVSNDLESFNQEIHYVDSTFFDVFSLELIKGTSKSVLKNPNDVVLTEEASKRYFGSEDPIGQSLTANIFGEEKVFTVQGIAKNIPSNSSIDFSFLVRTENRPYYEQNSTRWRTYNTPLFVKVDSRSNIELVKSKMNDIGQEKYAERIKEYRARFGLSDSDPLQEYLLTSLKNIHFDASANWHKVSNPLYSYILGIIAVFILLIACINYVTLAIAQSSKRAKEVGIRKTSGATQKQLAFQFWGETQIITFLAMIGGVCLTELILPFFNSVTTKSLSIQYSQDATFFIILFLITFITGLVAGTYPALILSKHEPAKALKGAATFQFKPKLTKSLLVIQYSLSIFLIISASIMYKQLEYVSSKDLGYNEEQIVFVPTYTPWDETGDSRLDLFRNQLNGVRGVTQVSGMSPAFTSGTSRYGYDVNGEEKLSYIYYIDPLLTETLDFEFVKGRALSSEIASDKNAIIVNEALVKGMGWDNPIGEGVPWKDKDVHSKVVGVVKDFHFQSLEAEIQPMLFHIDSDHSGISQIAVKIEEGMIAETLPKLEQAWNEIAPFTPFDFWFLDDAVAEQYTEYNQWLKIIGSATVIAILIACLGLFGLAGLIAINKTKEVGIRKVLGARLDQIILLLNKDIVMLISISLIIAAPISWFIMTKWLSDFSYQVTIGIDIFAISALTALSIAILTVSYHSIKAALSNPVDSLKSE